MARVRGLLRVSLAERIRVGDLEARDLNLNPNPNLAKPPLLVIEGYPHVLCVVNYIWEFAYVPLEGVISVVNQNTWWRLS